MRGLHSTMCSTPFLIEMRLCERANVYVLFELKFVSVQLQSEIVTLRKSTLWRADLLTDQLCAVEVKTIS